MVQRVLARAFATLLVASMLALAVFSGRAFLWCAGMQEARASCCCSSESDGRDDGPTLQRQPCCEAKAVSQAPDAAANEQSLAFAGATAGPSPRVSAAPLFTRSIALGAQRLARPPARSPQPRAPPHRLNCVYLI